MMKRPDRRRFLKDVGIRLGVATGLGGAETVEVPQAAKPAAKPIRGGPQTSFNTVIDFRFAPLAGQAAYCFPDDHHKSLIGERGDLRYGHPGQYKDIHYFPRIVEFSAEGMEPDIVKSQWVEKPGVPVVHTMIDRPDASIELITFASNRDSEGRVDNVILEIRPRAGAPVRVNPVVEVKTKEEVIVHSSADMSWIQLGGKDAPLFLMVNSSMLAPPDAVITHRLVLANGVASADRPLRAFLRFPQEGQTAGQLRNGLSAPDALLQETRSYWEQWKPFEGKVSWSLPGRHGEFLAACARNIQQAREVKEGKSTFQVGPTVYRGLWVADGHFILEAARYLGYDAEAQQGLEATWNRQRPDGGVFAGGGEEHWKETGIALFTITRQAELAQDWSYFRKMQPNLLRAVDYVRNLRARAKQEGSACGRYGLLPKGFPDGGIGGIREELTNTIWTLAGLKAVGEAGERLGLGELVSARALYAELRSALTAAAQQEMRRHAGGFDYLPMLLKDDTDWSIPDEWQRSRPQAAQWALSQAIYPGTVFERNDPIVDGHIKLMQSCTEEDIPAETGWITHQGLWNYGAAFVAHVYLWAGLQDWARQTFVGFLNHASPLYCWREEQPLRRSLLGSYIGDMPHNWASAECILYLRHMLVLEDGQSLRLLEGIGSPELDRLEPFKLIESPTRFGRVSVQLEPEGKGAGWTLRYSQTSGPLPERVVLPALLGARFKFSEVRGAQQKREGDSILVAPQAANWLATWKA